MSIISVRDKPQKINKYNSIQLTLIPPNIVLQTGITGYTCSTGQLPPPHAPSTPPPRLVKQQTGSQYSLDRQGGGRTTTRLIS